MSGVNIYFDVIQNQKRHLSKYNYSVILFFVCCTVSVCVFFKYAFFYSKKSK